jgi:Glyoxalase/Bleomycin resistance protein/Dioxygenase superfamily
MVATAGEGVAVRAAELAELIVDEISHAEQDWDALERRARELVVVIASADACGASARRGAMTGVVADTADPAPPIDGAPTIGELLIADQGARWEQLGFDVRGARWQLGRVCIRFVEPSRRLGIVGWSLRSLLSSELDGLPTSISQLAAPDPTGPHPNGVSSIDHVVAISPALDRSVTALRAAGLDLRRVREEPTPAGAPRQAFFRLGAEILELVQEPPAVLEREGGSDRPAHFWGLALRCEDLERTVERLGEHVSEIRPAVQPGRRIATVRRSAGVAVPLALMSEPPARS